MSITSSYTYRMQLLKDKSLAKTELAWVLDQIEYLHMLFDNPTWSQPSADAQHTQAQVGYLAGVMDLEREDRIECLKIILGRNVFWDTGDIYPGSVGVEQMETPEEYPGPSSKDTGITRWMNSVLLEYYLNGDGYKLNAALGYSSKTTNDKARRVARSLARQAKADAHAQQLANQPKLIP